MENVDARGIHINLHEKNTIRKAESLYQRTLEGVYRSVLQQWIYCSIYI